MFGITRRHSADGRRDAVGSSDETAGGFRDLYVSARDGLRLYARDYGSRTSLATPVVCLPGLARTAGDFDDLARHLSSSRRVLALDYRGRGNSEWSRDWRQYDVRVEADDALSVLTAAGIHEAIFVGTSRGGLIIMALGAMRPTLVRAAVLNDVGPVVDGKGLMRIRGYVGKLPNPADYTEGGIILKRLMDAQFPKLTDADWQAMARQTWRDSGKKDKRLTPAYDPSLMKSLEAIDFEAPLPPLWHLFEGLRQVPVLVLRGANSDILAPATLNEMAERHPRLTSFVVADQGHAPLLTGPDMLDRIGRFVAEVDGRERNGHA